jgi:hypothetical protein
MIAEDVGSEGTYKPPLAQFAVSDATPHLTGGTMGLEPIAGQRWGNQAPVSAELVASCDVNGPFLNANPLITAALAGGAGELPSYSVEINPGLGTSIHLLGAGVDKFSLKGAVGSAVTYSATFKGKSIATAAAGTPTAAAVTPFGLAEVAITGPSLAATATAFQVDIDNGIKTQAVFSSIISAYVFSTTFAVTGKVTAVMTGIGDITGYLASSSISIVVVLTNGTGTKTYTMGKCLITDLGAAVKVGSNTLQDISFIAFANGATAALVAS